MSRAVIVAVVMMLCVFHLAAYEPAGSDPAPRNALLFELSELAISTGGGGSWLVGIAAEYQRTLGNHVALSVIPELTVGTVRNEGGALIGLTAHPFGGGLRGMFIGAYPGFLWAARLVHFVAEADAGYQWVLARGFVIHLSIGARHDSRTGINRSGSFRIGLAF